MRYPRQAALGFALMIGACTMAQPPVSAPEPAGRAEWNTWLVQAAQEASVGNYAVAERLLAEYGAKYPSTPEAAEAMYWRGLFKMDPSNAANAPREAAVLLDGYLASGTPTHRSEAQTLRRVATALDASTRAVPPVAVKTEVVKVEDKAREEEIARLRDELGKANAELERIKRRLAQPKP